MKKTFVLAGLFFASIIALWWLEYARVPRGEERRARASRILGELFDVRVREISRVEVTKGKESILVERRGANSWRMLKPIDAPADPAVIEALIRNLIDLPRSADVGTIQESGSAYGLEPAEATIRLSGKREDGPAKGTEILASLEIGSKRRDARFVRALGDKGIEAIDPKLLTALDLPIADWREKLLLPLPTFQIAGLTARGTKTPYDLERTRGGAWILEKPLRVPANGIKVDNLLAELSSLRVADGAAGFVNDAPSDLAKFGLAPPKIEIGIRSIDPKAQPIVIQFGDHDPAKNDRVYARRTDHNSVVLVDSKILDNVPMDPKDLRINQVSILDPGRVDRIELDSPLFKSGLRLKRGLRAWEQVEPKLDQVDVQSVQSFILALANLQSSQLLDRQGAEDSRMTPPLMTIKVWEGEFKKPGVADSREPATSPESSASPSFEVTLGKIDVLRKTVYGQLPNDQNILAIPDLILKALPKNSVSFRDRNVLSVNPGTIRKLIVQTGRQSVELAPVSTNGPANQWKLTAPVVAKADMPSLSRLFATLTRLRAEEFVLAQCTPEEEHALGLDHPRLELEWLTERPDQAKASGDISERLRIGSRVSGSNSFYTKLDQSPFVFSLDAETVANLEGELRDHRVLSFPAERVVKLVLRWPDRQATYERSMNPSTKAFVWSLAQDSAKTAIDVNRFPSMITQLGSLETNRFLQYTGIIPVVTGLVPPRLSVELSLEGDSRPIMLRLGHVREDGTIYAAEGTASDGSVFFLPASAWMAMVSPNAAASSLSPLPQNVFAPAKSD